MTIVATFRCLPHSLSPNYIFRRFYIYIVNELHFQAFRHLYVIATEARWIQTVDVDTGLPVYAPLEITIKESEHYAETSFCEVTPCILPQRSLVSFHYFSTDIDWLNCVFINNKVQ